MESNTFLPSELARLVLGKLTASANEKHCINKKSEETTDSLTVMHLTS